MEVIPSSRICWLPFRPKELFCRFLDELLPRIVSVSCRESYDVHTLAGDSLGRGVPHLCMDTPSEDWPQRVAQLLVKQCGLSTILVATSEADFVKKGITLLLNASLRKAASKHLLTCKARQAGYFNRDICVTNLETMLLGALREARRVRGDVTEMKDIDLTKQEPVREILQFGPKPELMPFGETAEDQFQQFMQQLIGMSPSSGRFRIWEHMFETITRAIYERGFRNMKVVGLGSSCICVCARYSGKSSEVADVRAQYSGKVSDAAGIVRNELVALKITHFGHRVGQENRMHADANIISLNVFDSAGLRRSKRAADMLPHPYAIWYGVACAGVVSGSMQTAFPVSKNPRAANQPVRCRPVMTFAAYKYIEGGAMAKDPQYQAIVDEYRKQGIISDTRTRIIQAILFSVFFFNERGIFNMDMSLHNLALKKEGYRWLAIWIDTGGSLVIKDSVQGSGPVTLTRQSTSMAPRMGPVPGHSIPVLSKPRNGVSYLTWGFVKECAAAVAKSSRALTCLGTDTFCEDEVVNKIRQDKASEPKPFGSVQGSRWDSFGAASVVVQSFHPAPNAGEEREAWKKDLLAARTHSSSQRMREFLEKGMATGIHAQRPEVLDAYAELLHLMLRTDEKRIGVKDALLKLVLTTDTWSPDQMSALAGDGIPFDGQWPAGSPWHGKAAPRLEVVNEAGMGAGVRTAVDIKQGQLVTVYVGTMAEDVGVEEFPPNRRTVYAMKGGSQHAEAAKAGEKRKLRAGTERIHAVSDQPFHVLQAMNAAGPLLNASSTASDANVVMDRLDYWVDSDKNLYIGMYAKEDIAAGTFLHWEYDYRAGRGGAKSFSFPDD